LNADELAAIDDLRARAMQGLIEANENGLLDNAVAVEQQKPCAANLSVDELRARAKQGLMDANASGLLDDAVHTDAVVEREKAVSKIQAMQRAKLAKGEAPQEAAAAANVSADELQAINDLRARAKQGLLDANSSGLLNDAVHTDDVKEREKAALKIQAIQKGNAGRKEAAANKS